MIQLTEGYTMNPNRDYCLSGKITAIGRINDGIRSMMSRIRINGSSNGVIFANTGGWPFAIVPTGEYLVKLAWNDEPLMAKVVWSYDFEGFPVQDMEIRHPEDRSEIKSDPNTATHEYEYHNAKSVRLTAHGMHSVDRNIYGQFTAVGELANDVDPRQIRVCYSSLSANIGMLHKTGSITRYRKYRLLPCGEYEAKLIGFKPIMVKVTVGDFMMQHVELRYK